MTNDEVTSTHNHITAETNEKRDSISKAQGDFRQDAHNVDAEEKHTYGEVNQLPVLQRKLRSRHLQMIAIGELPSPTLCDLKIPMD